MAGCDRANDFLLKIPFAVTLDLMNTLDIDRGWESVAAAAGFTFDRIQQLGIKLTQNLSPTRSLLWQLGSLNYTVSDLHETLKIAKRLREMQTLETYVKEGSMKGATVKPKSPPSSLSSLLSQINKSDLKCQGRPPGSSFSMSGSELNFNQPSSPVDKAKVIQSKNYEDKIIPGTNSPLYHPQANADIVRSILSGHQTALPAGVCKSMPPFHHQPFSQKQPGEGPGTGGVENVTLSGQSFHTSSASKSIQSHSVTSSSLNTSQHKLDASSSTQPDSTETKVSFSYRELFNATDGFHKDKILGEGAFGNVYRGTLNQQECAIKRLHSSTTDSQKSDQVKSELAALLKYRQENIVPLYGYAENASELCLVYQYMVNGSLEDRLLRKKDTPSLTWERRLNILIGSCKGLNFLHTMGDIPLIHGDIKSANILLDQYFEAKLGDFGQAKYATRNSTDTTGFTHITVAETTTKLFGTKAYLAPELSTNGTQSVKSDIYALGVVFMEVCSGQKAYDQSRNAGTFLADHFRNDVADKGEGFWKEQFQDRTLLGVPDDIFIGVLKIATRCVNTAKKARPDTTKLLGEMKLIYKQNQERLGADEGSFCSISTSLQIDSRNTMSSCYPTSNHESHLGGQAIQSLQVCGTDHQKNIRQELHRFQPPLQKLPEQLRSPVQEPAKQQQAEHVAASSSTVDTQITTELRNHPSSDSSPKSFPPNVPLSEPFLLQAAYDRQSQRKIIDRLSGVLQKEEPALEEHPSDPKKLQKIDKFDMEQQNSMPSHCTVSQKENQEQDCFPQADPKKLAQLKAYDEANFGTNDQSGGDPIGLDCDPVKLAYLQKFDDNLYKQTPQRNCDTQQTSVSQTRQELNSLKDNFMTPLYLPDVQARYVCNTTTHVPTYVAHNGPTYLPHYTNPVVTENDGVRYARHENTTPESEKDLEFRYTAEHNGNRRPSDDSNINTVWSRDQDEGAGSEVIVDKPIKQKMNILFAKYYELQNAADGDDDGCNNEELEVGI